MRTDARCASVSALALLLGVGQPLAAQDRPAPASSEALETGARLYRANCAGCHGTTGDLVPGADLRSGQLRRASSDAELAGVIANGISGSPMPAHRLEAHEIAGLVAFVRSMRESKGQAVEVGDAARGQVVFEGKGGCTGCHRVSGKGPRTAPDLSDIGTTRRADALRRSLLDPTAAMQPINRLVRAVTRDGKVIHGRRLNEDTYTVQLIDDGERLVSLVKADLREYAVSRTSPMPSYKDKLSAGELADLVGYLVTLRGVSQR